MDANTRVVALRQRLPLHAAANSGHVHIQTLRMCGDSGRTRLRRKRRPWERAAPA